MIRIEHLRKAWPGFSLEIERLEIGAGEYFVVLGPSGAGKTVLLSCLCGIARPDEGRIYFGDADVTDLPPERRSVGWVSQSNTLFPHLTVAQNIRFGRRYCGTGILPAKSNHGQDAYATFDQRASRLIELLELRPLLGRLPADLSGGEAQRVMLARALALGPRVLLLDEPLRGLDPTTQDRLRDELAQIHRELGTTTFHITHDHVEARALADRIAVLRAGRIEQIGAPGEIFERPATVFVARFTGCENLFRLSDTAPVPVQAQPSLAADDLPLLDRSLLPQRLIPADAAFIAIRPEHLTVLPEPTGAGLAPNSTHLLRFTAVVESIAPHGAWLRVTLRAGATPWIALLPPRAVSQALLGREVSFIVSPQHLIPLNPCG